MRGDWQLLPWLGRHVPGRDGARLRNRLSALDRWKIVDNLRRSLIAPSLVLLAFCGWLAVPGVAPVWTLLTVAAPGSYLVTFPATGVARSRRRGTARDRWRHLRDRGGRWLPEVVFMANEAVLCLDEIGRALWRLAVSRRGMLEWITSAQVSRAGADTRARYWGGMAGAPALALAMAAAPAARAGALPLPLVWTLSPGIASLICRPWGRECERLSRADRA